MIVFSYKSLRLLAVLLLGFSILHDFRHAMNRMNPPALPRDIRESGTPRRTSTTNPTSLPSIHQLHPYLQQSPQSTASYSGSSYSYTHGGLSNPYNASGANPASSSQQTIEDQRSFDQFGSRRSSMRSVHNVEEEGVGGDSDLELEGAGEHRELQEPPKKKRRRQALSCTGEP